MDRSEPADPIFECGPLRWLRTRLGFYPRVERGAVRAAIITWMPLLLLSLWEGAQTGWDVLRSFGLDVGVHVRMLIALPVLVLAERYVVPRLETLCDQFRVEGLIRPEDEPRFDAAIASTRRLRESVLADLSIAILAWSFIPVLLATTPAARVPSWTRAEDAATFALTPAGWWALLVSIPLLLAVFLAWAWRLVLWARLLWKVSKLDLRLVPAHPDKAAGLMFVAYSLRTFSILGFVVGCLVASGIANRVILQGVPFLEYRYVIGAAVLGVMVTLTLPLLAFAGRLASEWRRGLSQYGAIGVSLGQQFERRWFARLGSIDESALEVPDFSAQTDLYQIVSNVYQMRMIPVDLRSMLYLAWSTVIPFVPVLLATVPFDEVLRRTAQFVL